MSDLRRASNKNTVSSSIPDSFTVTRKVRAMSAPALLKQAPQLIPLSTRDAIVAPTAPQSSARSVSTSASTLERQQSKTDVVTPDLRSIGIGCVTAEPAIRARAVSAPGNLSRPGRMPTIDSAQQSIADASKDFAVCRQKLLKIVKAAIQADKSQELYDALAPAIHPAASRIDTSIAPVLHWPFSRRDLIECLFMAIEQGNIPVTRLLARFEPDLNILQQDENGAITRVLATDNRPMQRCLAEIGIDFSRILTRLLSLSNPALVEKLSYWYTSDMALRDWEVVRNVLDTPGCNALSGFSGSAWKNFDKFYCTKIFPMPLALTNHVDLPADFCRQTRSKTIFGSYDYVWNRERSDDFFLVKNMDLTVRVLVGMVSIHLLAMAYGKDSFRKVEAPAVKAYVAHLLADFAARAKLGRFEKVYDLHGLSPQAIAQIGAVEKMQIDALSELGRQGQQHVIDYLENFSILDDCLHAVGSKSSCDMKALTSLVTGHSGIPPRIAEWLAGVTVEAIRAADDLPMPPDMPKDLTISEHLDWVSEYRYGQVKSLFIARLEPAFKDRALLDVIRKEIDEVHGICKDSYQDYIQWHLQLLRGAIDSMRELEASHAQT